ncbi:MAG: cyclic nucleotide-binding domain-containing protein [Actinomycetota bacterium]
MAGPVYDTPLPRKDAGKLAIARRVEILGTVPLFAGVPKRHLRHLAKQSRVEVFEAGQDMVTEGQPSTAAFVIVAGSAVVRRNGRKLAEVAKHDLVGELGLLCERPRNASVRTTTPVEAITLDRRGLRAAVEEFPALGWHLLETVAERLS